MQSLELILGSLERSESVLLARIEDMRDHCMVAPTPAGGGHTLWSLGHLAFIENLVIREYMLGEPNPLAGWAGIFDGDEVPQDPASYPAFDEALARCRDARAATVALLRSLTEDGLDRASANVPPGATHLFGTWRQCFLFTSEHWLMHRGQIADARRAAGLRRAWY